MWVQGQQTGSTAIGYWAIFDAIGVAMSRLWSPNHTLPWVACSPRPICVPHVLLFSPSASVCVCKKVFKHLSANTGDGRHPTQVHGDTTP